MNEEMSTKKIVSLIVGGFIGLITGIQVGRNMENKDAAE